MRICRFLVPFLFVAPLTAGIAGCGKIAEKIQEKVVETAIEKAVEAKSGGQMKLDINGKQVTSVSKNGKERAAFGEGVSLPTDFPKQVPIYPGATLTTTTADNSGTPRYGVFFNVADPPDKVAAYYKNALKGYKLEQETAGQESEDQRVHLLVFANKAQKERVQIMIGSAKESAGSTVMLNTDGVH